MSAGNEKVYQYIAAATAAVATAGAAYAVYQFLNGDKSADPKQQFDLKSVTVEQVHSLLQQVVDSQEQMKVVMKSLTKELVEKNATFEEVYSQVQATHPMDPLEQFGLSMRHFDMLLDKFRGDAGVREKIVQIMGASFNPSENKGTMDPKLTPKQVVEVHAFMLEELKRLTVCVTTEMDPRISTIAVQAIIGAGVEKAFKVSSEDVEASVFYHRNQLSTDQQFASINLEMRRAMEALVGVDLAQSQGS